MTTDKPKDFVELVARLKMIEEQHRVMRFWIDQFKKDIGVSTLQMGDSPSQGIKDSKTTETKSTRTRCTFYKSVTPNPGPGITPPPKTTPEPILKTEKATSTEQEVLTQDTPRRRVTPPIPKKPNRSKSVPPKEQWRFQSKI